MLPPYERRLLAFYLANIASGLHHRDLEAWHLAEWFAEFDHSGAFSRHRTRPRPPHRAEDTEEAMSTGKLRRLGETLRDEYSTIKTVRYDRTAQRLRRFVFKVTLDYLSPGQAQGAFRTWFALTPPAELSALTALTPGDFAVVRRRAQILGCLQEPQTLVTMLRAECDAKSDRPRAIGFRP